MNKSSLMLVIIIVLVAAAGFVVYKNRSENMNNVPYTQVGHIISPTPVQDINQQALNQELDQIDQMAKSIDDSNDKDSDLNNLSL